MTNNEEIIKQADYYLEHDVTIKKASEALGISLRTLQLHLKQLETIAPMKYRLVQDKKENHVRQGVVKGGATGKRGPSWDRDQVIDLANKMIEKELTYEEAEREFGIPKSTLNDMLHRGVDDEKTASLLYALAEAHRKGLDVSSFLSNYYQEHVTIDEISHELRENSNRKK